MKLKLNHKYIWGFEDGESKFYGYVSQNLENIYIEYEVLSS